VPLCISALLASRLGALATEENPRWIFGAGFGVTWGSLAADKAFGVKDRRRTWPRLLPPAVLSGWIWGDARGGFQRKVFLGSGRDIPQLSLTSPAETCQKGALLKKITPTIH